MTGNKSIDRIILILTLLTTIGTAGVFFYTEMIYKRPVPKNEEELAKLKDETKNINVPQSFKLDDIIVNLPSNTSRLRFLNVGINIVVFEDKDITTLEESKNAILDIIIEIASNMEPDELNSISGKLIFESRIKNKVNQVLKKSIVKELFYTKFVVQ